MIRYSNYGNGLKCYSLAICIAKFKILFFHFHTGDKYNPNFRMRAFEIFGIPIKLLKFYVV